MALSHSQHKRLVALQRKELELLSALAALVREKQSLLDAVGLSGLLDARMPQDSVRKMQPRASGGAQHGVDERGEVAG